MTEFPLERRDLLRATGAGLLGTVGVGAAQTTGTQETSGGDLIWEFTQPSDPVQSSPTIVDGTVYVGSTEYDGERGALYAVDTATGDQEWAFTQPSSDVNSSPTVVDGTVYVGSGNGNLYAVDAATGTQEWAFTQPPNIRRSSPTVVNGTVYVGAGGTRYNDYEDAALYAVDTDSGTQEWVFTQPSDRVESSPTVADGTVYVGAGGSLESTDAGSDPTLYAVDTATGDQEWAFTQPSETIRSSPTVVDGTVFIGFDNSLSAVDAATGDQEWTFTQSFNVFRGYSSPTVVDGTVFIGSSDSDSALYAVDAATGDQEWEFDTDVGDGFGDSSPTVADGTVYIGSKEYVQQFSGALHAVDAATGDQEWVFTQPSDWVVSSPTVADGTVYVGSNDNNLYAVDAGVEGSSEGSRVRLRTLGHHDENIGQPPGGGGELDLSVQAGTAPPGGTYTLTYQITNTGSTTIGDGDDNSPSVTPSQGPPGFVTNEGSIPDGGSVDEFTWFDWSIESGETLEANLEVKLPDDIDPGEYEFTILAEGTREYDETSVAVTVGDTGDTSLALAITDATAEVGGTATVTYILTNEGNAESSGLQGRIDLPPGNWQLGESGSFTSLRPGESDSVSAEVLVPESASGEYTIDGSVTDDAGNKATASGTVTVEPPGEPSWTLTAQAFQPVDGPGPLPAQPGETFRLSLVITNTGTVPGDASIQFVSASSGEHNADYYGDQFAVESHTDDGGEWFVEGWRWDENTDSGPIAPDETREPVVELAVAEDVSAGEYTFAMSGPDGAMATATVTVAPLDGTRQQKLALAGRIDDAATFDSLLTREPSTLAFQPEQEVARNSLDLLEESVPDGSLSRETAIDAANRLIWGEQLTEDVLQYTGDATITTDVTELPDDLNIAQQTAGPLLKVVVSLLLQTQAASKIVSSVSQKLPGAVSIDPSQIEGVAKKLLDIALGFNSETDDVPADAPDTTDPTTLLENLRPEVATIVEEIENGVTTSVDAVLSTIDTVVQPFIDLAAGTLRVFLEHIALAGAVTEGIDAGLSGAVTNLHSALRPESIASGGLAGSQSQAEEAYIEGGAGLIQTAIESADVLDGFGTQEKLRDSTELAVNVLKLEPEEIDITTIVEFSIGQIREIPYGEALDLGLGIGFMLNLHASHSNAHTGIINGE